MRTVAFGLGGNIGDAQRTVREGAHALAADPQLIRARLSASYATSPVGGPPQADFINAVLVAQTDATPQALLALAAMVEDEFGRTRSVRWGPRTLDVDVLAVGDIVSSDPVLTLPHPRAHLRAFVLVPWASLDPEFMVAGHGSVASLLAALSAEEVAAVTELTAIQRDPRA